MIAERNSYRLLFDMQAAQTAGSAHRGVGRYSSALFKATREISGACDLRALVSDALRHSADLSDLPANRVLRMPQLPDWTDARKFRGGQQDDLDALAYMARVMPLSPDVIHVSHAFEGFSERVPLPSRQSLAPRQVLSATLYDLIPLIFPEHYFQDESFRLWYKQRLQWLRDADLLLAISECSRQDAISLLGIEPWRIITIAGGISDHFKPFAGEGPARAAAKADLARRYGLKPKFVLYSGGDDFRKNIAGAIRGFSAVPVERRKGCCLVIVCAMEAHRQETYRDIARNAGLSPDEIIITGFVSEEDLVSFYQHCDLLIFPSLYEGLGFPVLEGMACGAPVIGGDNSSICELIVRQDALFDSSSTESIAEAITNVLSDKGFAADLSEKGVMRAKAFTWQQSASIALEAFQEASERKCERLEMLAVSGGLPRKKLAVLTPLPPSRSGIADYNAEFLPFLARHFEIDLYVAGEAVARESINAAFSVFDAAAFEKVATNYDVILYEFGNSEFHAHMLPLLERFPGIVCLHDAFLSGLMGYFDFFLGDSGSYQREMIAAHGPRARLFFLPGEPHPNGNTASMISLPCIQRVLQQAIGIISHSPFNLETAREAHPEGWAAPFRIIPQMVRMPASMNPKERFAFREALGFSSSDIVIATFGHVAWTKCGDVLLEGVEQMSDHPRRHVHLVFAGEMARDDFGEALRQKIQKSFLTKNIRVTGYLNQADYARYLRAADIAVQLRINSRGGTPKGVLDCMSHGLPVVVNDEASYRDYPADVVVKIPPEPDAMALAAALNQLSGSIELCEEYSRAATSYVRANHDPANAAAQYAAFIWDCAERARHTSGTELARQMAPHLARSADNRDATAKARDWLAASRRPLFSRRRLLIDVTYLASTDHRTGIPRVVKEITRAAYAKDLTDFEPVAVRLVNGELHRAGALLQALGVCGEPELQMPEYGQPVWPQPGDILLMIDSSWHQVDQFAPVFDAARQAHVPIYTVIYDLLPMRLPADCVVPGGKEWFESWMAKVVSHSQGLIGISRCVAEDIAAYVETVLPSGVRPKIGYWHLGADFSKTSAPQPPSADVRIVQGRSYLFMVGTIEPRKSHAIALDAMEQLWAGDSELCLVIAGREGWLVDDLMTRLRRHRELGRRLYFFEGASDSDIEFLYRHAEALLFLSKGEGFGLPLVEAAYYGVPLICSDLPVFREIGDGFAHFVDHGSGAAAAAGIAKWMQLKEKGLHLDSKNMPRLSWRESADQLIDLVMNNRWIRSEW